MTYGLFPAARWYIHLTPMFVGICEQDSFGEDRRTQGSLFKRSKEINSFQLCLCISAKFKSSREKSILPNLEDDHEPIKPYPLNCRSNNNNCCYYYYCYYYKNRNDDNKNNNDNNTNGALGDFMTKLICLRSQEDSSLFHCQHYFKWTWNPEQNGVRSGDSETEWNNRAGLADRPICLRPVLFQITPCDVFLSDNLASTFNQSA